MNKNIYKGTYVLLTAAIFYVLKFVYNVSWITAISNTALCAGSALLLSYIIIKTFSKKKEVQKEVSAEEDSEILEPLKGDEESEVTEPEEETDSEEEEGDMWEVKENEGKKKTKEKNL